MYTLQNWSNFHFTVECLPREKKNTTTSTEKDSELEGISGGIRKPKKDEEEEAFDSKKEICHLDAAQTSTSLVMFTLKLHFSVPFV